MNPPTETEKTSSLQLFSESDAELLRIRREMREAVGCREDVGQDAKDEVRDDPARAGDPSFQLKTPR